jgi:hypothetical protein
VRVIDAPHRPRLLASHLGQVGQGLAIGVDDLREAELRLAGSRKRTHDIGNAQVRLHRRPPDKEGEKKQSGRPAEGGRQ